MTSLPVFLCDYYRSYGWGGFEEIYTLCFANTEQEALGLILTEYPNTKANYWAIREQCSDKLDILEITTRSN